MEHSNTNFLLLPIGAASQVDVGRLLREAEALDEFLNQSAVRTPASAAKLPKTSKLFEEMMTTNRVNALLPEDRLRVIEFLKSVKEQAPVLHMSFSADPSALFTQKLIVWLRKEIHPLVLLQVGLQPNIGAGCVVRTTNKYFDFSLRERFKESRKTLLAKIRNSETVAHEKAAS